VGAPGAAVLGRQGHDLLLPVAAIQIIDPQLWMQPRIYQRNAIFARGEVPRLALSAMREAGVPLPVAVIVRKMLAAKGVELPARRTSS
jgi:hypothetical protein